MFIKAYRLICSLVSILAILSSTSASPSPQSPSPSPSPSVVTFWQFANPSNPNDPEATALPTNLGWAEPIGTGSNLNGEDSEELETTYVYNAVLPVEPTGGTSGTQVMTYSETLAVGASGIKILSYLGIEQVECTLTSPNSGDCVYEGVVGATNSGGLTVTETGLMAVPVVVAVSTPAPTGSGSGSEESASVGTSTQASGGGGLSAGATGLSSSSSSSSGSSSSSSAAAGAASPTQSNGALGGVGSVRVGLLGVAAVVALVGGVSGFVF